LRCSGRDIDWFDFVSVIHSFVTAKSAVHFVRYDMIKLETLRHTNISHSTTRLNDLSHSCRVAYVRFGEFTDDFVELGIRVMRLWLVLFNLNKITAEGVSEGGLFLSFAFLGVTLVVIIGAVVFNKCLRSLM
jgi:hypothetical protein